MVLEFTNKYLVSFIEEVFKMPIFGPVCALGPKKGGTCKIKIWKSKTKSYLGAKFYACHLGTKWGNLYS